MANDSYHKSGPSLYTARHYANIDYRYYFFAFGQSKTRHELYINPFCKIGTETIWPQDGYLLQAADIVGHHSRFQAYGLALGMQFSLTENQRFGADINAGVLYRFRFVDRETSVNTDLGTDQIFDVRRQELAPHARINFYYFLISK